MATVTPGTGATINATTIEGQLWQMVHIINNAERGLSDQRFTVTKTEDYILEAQFTVPGQMTFNTTTGVFAESAASYLPSFTFSAGSPTGTIKSTTLSQYFIDVINYIIHWQNTPSKNTNSLQNVTMSFNFNSLEYSGSIVLPYVSVPGANGSMIETATEWLLT